MIKKIGVLYFSQIYKAILPLVFVPLIMNELGVEQYGMIAFYSMLLGWLGLLDAGISGTFIKLVAINKNEIERFNRVCLLFKKVSVFFLFMSLFLVFFMRFNSEYISTKWLNTKVHLDVSMYCLNLIGITLSIVYLRTYVSSFLNGMEKQLYIAMWSIFSTSALYGCSYWIVKYMSNKLPSYFNTVTIITAIDLAVIILMVIFVIYKNKERIAALPPVTASDNMDLSLSNVLKFSFQLSGLSLIWVVATQIDKLALSTYTELSVYSHYQIAAQIGGALAVFSTPLSQFLLPRLSALYAEKKEVEFTSLLVNSFIFFLVILGPIIPYFFFFGDKLISLWMQNDNLGSEINNYAKWIVSSAYVSTSMNFLFMLLYVKNKLKHHFYAYALYSMLTIPISIYVAKHYGAHASAKFVFAHNFIFMVVWGGICVNKYLKYFNKVFFVVSSVVFFISLLVFSSLSMLSAYQINYINLMSVFLFPVINVSILLSFFYWFRKPIERAVRTISIKVT